MTLRKPAHCEHQQYAELQTTTSEKFALAQVTLLGLDNNNFALANYMANSRKQISSQINDVLTVAALQATVVYVKNRKPFPASVEIFGPRMRICISAQVKSICQKRMAEKFLAKTWPKS
jgi:hypothetical protein